MQQLIRENTRSRAAKALRLAAVVILFIAALGRPNIASAGPHGGGGGFHGGGCGGFHGGGFHAGSFGGFHGGGFHAGAFGGGWQGGHWNHGWHNGRHGWWWGPAVGWGYYDYPYGAGYWPDYGYYGDYGYGQPAAGQYWYYCSDPSGYYPYVPQCNVPWQPVPPS